MGDTNYRDLARRLRLNRAAQEGSANPGPILVGELNPHGVDPAHALLDEPRGASGWRLRMILGLTTESYLALRRYNLCTTRWSLRSARTRAQEIRDAHPGRVLVLLGVKVAGAFGLQDGHPFSAVGESYRDRYSTREAIAMEVGERPTYVLLPHPSGLNRAWNEPGAVERTRALMRRVCPELPVGETAPSSPCSAAS